VASQSSWRVEGFIWAQANSRFLSACGGSE
jgi:hypothetical protein